MVDGVILIQVHGCSHGGGGARTLWLPTHGAFVVETHQVTRQTRIVHLVLWIQDEKDKVETRQQRVGQL